MYVVDSKEFFKTFCFAFTLGLLTYIEDKGLKLQAKKNIAGSKKFFSRPDNTTSAIVSQFYTSVKFKVEKI
jgi:hypothetical protein